ncbi:hypothetical protein BBBOND_0110220 [Babesia bigemina]|uniref:Uncharacterized protein n=1 Tax=Babesia bigemina TaxID=5866 RepID=A0A061D724_BABBI|nr:hypothetical protein BBBOND_0110220 [Babesia bigemina]CDR94724.1 hypothetical protein BBBOND_0110220 [Babesia bigemina]|eukprot:XP_012766910.1 hypothetical protein BBBOND_0110220 [Babesia bigemina]
MGMGSLTLRERAEGTSSGSGTCCSWLRGLGLGGEDEHINVVQPHTSGPPSTTNSSPAVLPIIILPVALIIVVICVMIYFRIRPFHRSSDCVDDESHEL